MTVQVTLPSIKIKWLRGRQTISYKRPSTYLILGQRGTGKSSLLESIATRYPKVIDLFGSKDNEGLGWCKKESPFQNILLVVGKNVRVSSQWSQVKIQNLRLSDFKNHEVVLTVHAFYNTTKEYFDGLQRITNLLWEKRSYWTQPWFVLIREAANWIYSRLQIVKDTHMAKADFIQCLREARHSGLAVGVDTIRWTNIDKEVRDVSDYIFLKRVGAIGLPKDLRFVYRYVEPNSLMRAHPKVFVLVTAYGSLGYGAFQYPPWHKEERENILRKLDIEVNYVAEKVEDRTNTVGVFEHAKMIEAFQNHDTFGKAANALGRAKSTVHAHVTEHNKEVFTEGVCSRCAKADSPLARTILNTGRKSR